MRIDQIQAPPPLAPTAELYFAAVDLSVLFLEDANHYKSTSTSPTSLARTGRVMLRYYTSCFAFLLTTNLENNYFLSVLLPMAFECPALLKALVAWSSTHLALRDSRFEAAALRHRGAALAALNAAMNEAQNSTGDTLSHEMALAVTMVLCSMESIGDGRSAAWYHHLRGGAAVLGMNASLPHPPSFTLAQFEGSWLLRNFAYHDILMSVSMDRRPLVSGDYWNTTPAKADGNPTKPDPYFGLAASILHLVSQTSHLATDFAESVGESSEPAEAEPYPHIAGLSVQTDGQSLLLSHESHASSHTQEPPTSTPLSTRAQEIEAQLLGWTCPPGHKGSALEQLAEAYRSAALIYLYRTLRRFLGHHLGGFNGYNSTLHEKIQDQVRRICAIANEMPLGSLAECTLLFPLFMAGGEVYPADAAGEAAMPEEREDDDTVELLAEPATVILNRLKSMNQCRRFRNVDACIDVLEELWQQRAAQSENIETQTIDWLDVVKARGYTLALT